jgi:Lamin Tail Domain
VNDYKRIAALLLAGFATLAIIAMSLGSSAAGPSGITGTPLFLPLVLKEGTPTLTPTATATSTSTPTETQPGPPASLHITALSGQTTPEFVTVQNTGGQSQDMTGWTLVSVVGPQTFNFPNGYTLGAGATVRIESYTGASNNPPSVLYWTADPVWNNAGDKAELRDNSNAVIDSRCYGNACP